VTADLSNRARGRFGEDLAARWYTAHGYEVVTRNWRCTDGELDIVARRPGTLVICEVKARRSAAYGGPAAAVGHDKQMRLRRLALRFLAEHGLHEPVVRFDVACVIGAGIEVIEGAF
jgi:putative endonuclease